MIDLTIGADHRGMELKDQVSKWLCPIDECMGDIVTFHDIGIYENKSCLLYTSPSPRDGLLSRMPSSA